MKKILFIFLLNLINCFNYKIEPYPIYEKENGDRIHRESGTLFKRVIGTLELNELTSKGETIDYHDVTHTNVIVQFSLTKRNKSIEEFWNKEINFQQNLFPENIKIEDKIFIHKNLRIFRAKFIEKFEINNRREWIYMIEHKSWILNVSISKTSEDKNEDPIKIVENSILENLPLPDKRKSIKNGHIWLAIWKFSNIRRKEYIFKENLKKEDYIGSWNVDAKPKIIPHKEDLHEIYPEDLRKYDLNIHSCLLNLYIDENGNLDAIYFISPQDPLGFSDRAMHVIRNATIKPAKSKGRFVKVQHRVPVLFIP